MPFVGIAMECLCLSESQSLRSSVAFVPPSVINSYIHPFNLLSLTTSSTNSACSHESFNPKFWSVLALSITNTRNTASSSQYTHIRTHRQVRACAHSHTMPVPVPLTRDSTLIRHEPNQLHKTNTTTTSSTSKDKQTAQQHNKTQHTNGTTEQRHDMPQLPTTAQHTPSETHTATQHKSLAQSDATTKLARTQDEHKAQKGCWEINEKGKAGTTI